MTAFVCERDPERKDYVLGLIPLLGIGFHSFIDGFVYSIAFNVSILTGSLATLGMVLHEFPEGIVTYLLLVRAGFGERKALLLAGIAAAGTTPLTHRGHVAPKGCRGPLFRKEKPPWHSQSSTSRRKHAFPRGSWS